MKQKAPGKWGAAQDQGAEAPKKESFMTRLYVYLTSLAPTSLRREEGQTLTEYAIILAIVATGLIVALTALRDKLQTTYDTIVTQF
jgi:Flp pilus assembly pilin Flp